MVCYGLLSLNVTVSEELREVNSQLVLVRAEPLNNSKQRRRFRFKNLLPLGAVYGF